MYNGGYILSRELKDRQCTYEVKLRCVPATIAAVENNKYYIFRDCVCSLWYPVCNAHGPYCYLLPTRLYNIVPHCFINAKIKKKLVIKCAY